MRRSSNKPQQRGRLLSWLYLSRKALFTVLAVILSALAAAAASQLALTSVIIDRWDANDWRVGSWPGNESSMRSVPSTSFPDQGKVERISGGISLATSGVIGVFVLWAFFRGPVKAIYWQRLTVLILLGLNTALALGSAVYTLVLLGLSAHFDTDYALTLARPDYGSWVFRYNKGTFDRVTWACEVRELPGFDRDGFLHTACACGISVKLLTIVVFLLSASLCGLFVQDCRGDNELLRTWKDRRASWHEDYM